MKVTIASVRVCSVKDEYGAPVALSERRFRRGSDDRAQERVTGGRDEGD